MNHRSLKSTSRHGMAMMLVLLAVVISIVLSATFAASQATSIGITQNVDRRSRARAIAESAIALAASDIKTNPAWRTDRPNGTWAANQALSGGTYTVTGVDGLYSSSTGVVTGDGDLTDDAIEPVVLTAIGNFQGVTYQVRSQVTFVSPWSSPMATSRRVQMKNDSQIDSYHSGQGVYGGGNKGSQAVVTTNATQSGRFRLWDHAKVWGDGKAGKDADLSKVFKLSGSSSITGTKGHLDRFVFIPDVVIPTSIPASEGNKTYSSGTVTLSGTHHYGKLTIKGTAIVNVSGLSTIVCDNGLVMKNTGQLKLASGAVLSLYSKKRITITDDAQVNPTGAPLQMMIYQGTTQQIKLDQDAKLYGFIIAPYAPLVMTRDAQFFGGLLGRRITLTRDAFIHHDLDAQAQITGTATVDTPFSVVNTLALYDSAKIDSFDSDVAVYGGANVGSGAVVSTNAIGSAKIAIYNSARIQGNAFGGPGGLPTNVIKTYNSGVLTGARGSLSSAIPISAEEPPDDMAASVGDVTYSSGTTILTADLHCGKLTVSNSAILEISGDVVIYAEDTVTFQNSAQLRFQPEASLEMFIDGKLYVLNAANINTSVDPNLLSLHMMSSKDIEMSSTSQLCAQVEAGESDLLMRDSSQLYGTIKCNTATLEDNAQFHVDISDDNDDEVTIGPTPLVQWIEEQ